MLDAKFWRKTGIDIVACYRRHIFDPEGGGKKATDIDGSDYPRYSNKYELAKGKILKALIIAPTNRLLKGSLLNIYEELNQYELSDSLFELLYI